MLKFNREEFKDTVDVGDLIEVKINGRRSGGSEFARELNSAVVMSFPLGS